MVDNLEPRKKGVVRIHQAFARKMGVAILSGEIAPGEKIAGEIEQAAAHGLSRTAYREALRILIAKGLLESRPKAGTHVTPRNCWNLLDPDILEWMFSSTPDEGFIEDLFELRGILEPAAAALAAERYSPAHLKIMDDALDDMQRLGLASAEGQAADKRFHTAILDATGNEALATLAGSVGAAVSWTTQFKQRTGKVARDPVVEHREVRDAIASRDPEFARREMHRLLKLALADMA